MAYYWHRAVYGSIYDFISSRKDLPEGWGEDKAWDPAALDEAPKGPEAGGCGAGGRGGWG